jgi:hypothetical protein
MADRLTGKASYFLLGSAATQIPITKATPKVTRKLADTTDSGDYQSTPDMIFPTQIPVSAPLEMAIEGRYRFSSTPSAIVALLATSATNIPVVLGLNSGAIWGHGNFDISDFQSDIPFDDTVTYTCNIRSNGQWVPNA